MAAKQAKEAKAKQATDSVEKEDKKSIALDDETMIPKPSGLQENKGGKPAGIGGLAAAAAAAALKKKQSTSPSEPDDDFFENVDDVEETSLLKDKVQEFGNEEKKDNGKKILGVPPISNEFSINFSDSISSVEKCDKRIHIAIVSDREKSDYPLRALINSILNFTSTPVTVNIVTKNRIPFMDMLNTTSYFSVHYHDSTHLFKSSQKLVKETGFKTLHYSAKFGMQKLFLNELQFETTAQKIIVLDDDITFFTDITPLWDKMMENPRNISLYCPEDMKRVNRYFVNKNATDNGHSLRYCNSGLMGIPKVSNFTNLAIEATQKMTKQYDFSYSVADQDIVNRMLAENNNGFEFIPCQWACDVNSWYV